MNTSKYTLVDRLSIPEYADNLYNVSDESTDNRLEYYRMQARTVDADFIYCLNSEIDNQPFPFIYIYDERDKTHQRKPATINKQLWTIGEIALAILVYDDEIEIIDTRLPIIVTDGKEIENIFKIITQVDTKLKALIFEGRIIERSDRDYVSISPYNKLLVHIEKNILGKQKEINCSDNLLRKLVVRCILIKYIEEQVDENQKSIFNDYYFNSFIDPPLQRVATFCDVLRDGNIAALFKALNDKFNGGIFELDKVQESEILKCNLTPIANALGGHVETSGQGVLWPLYDLKLLPIEFISRLYEKFVTSSEGSQKDYGAYYTPPHLAHLLVDELLPFNSQIDFSTFKLIDPSCGSGVFLVLAYKRLITLWMLKNNKRDIKGKEDIVALQGILTNCIFGIDINGDAVSITATSLQIELTSHLQPKDINLLHFDNLQENGNLKECGFFKWYKTETNRFDVVVGNPPFNINSKRSKENIEKCIDDDFEKESYINEKGKLKSFPYKNPALTILYHSVESLLKPQGRAFMIMPASSFLYMPTALEFRKTVLLKWDVKKIYDFTPLRDYLWGKTKVATIAVYIKKEHSPNPIIEHIIVRSSFANEKGSIRFQIDKYDKFSVLKDLAIEDNYTWKINLLGGSRLGFYHEKYLRNFMTIKELLRNWSSSTGYREDKSSPNQINLKGKQILDSNKFDRDYVDSTMINPVTEDLFKRDVAKDVLTPPNILIRLNINYSMPIVLNTQDVGFFPGILGLKGKDENEMKTFVKLFKQNRELYKTLIKIKSSKIYIQQSGISGYTIDAQDIFNLPINVDDFGQPISFEPMSHIEQAVLEDTEMMALCLNRASGRLFDDVTPEELTQYGAAFCEILNFVYEAVDYLFCPVRCIIHDDYVWMSFEHTNEDKEMELQLSDGNKGIFQNILRDDISNFGLRINRIITSYSERNKVSFIKPRTLKYWTRSIGYRDAENVKAEMFIKGY